MNPKELLLATADSIEADSNWGASFCEFEETGCLCVLEHMSKIRFGTPRRWTELDSDPVGSSAVKTLASAIKRPGRDSYSALVKVYEWNDEFAKGKPKRTQTQVVGALRRAAARRGNRELAAA